MDAFFVSVELLRRPELRRPAGGGGGHRSPWCGRRGVVRGPPLRRVLGDAVRAGPPAVPDGGVPCRRLRRLRGDESRVIEIFESYTPAVEPISLDEAFLDVTRIGRPVRRRCGDRPPHSGRHRRRLSLTCSVGIAPNKFLAKMASVEAKPRARPTASSPARACSRWSPARRSPTCTRCRCDACGGSGRPRTSGSAGSGSARSETSPPCRRSPSMAASGGRTRPACSSSPPGSTTGRWRVERLVKSVSHEETFAFDLHDRADIRTQLVRMADGVASRLRASGLGARTISLKVRDATFTTITRSRTLPRAVDTAAAIVDVVGPLMDTLDPAGGVRLLGVAASKFAAPSEQLQLDGFDDDTASSSGARRARRSTWSGAGSGARRSARRAHFPTTASELSVAGSNRGARTRRPTREPRLAD